MAWWTWLISGFVLLVAEMILPSGFFLFFIGLGAILVGAIDVLGFILPQWGQWCLWAVISSVLLLAARKPVARLLKTAGPATKSEIEGADVLLLSDIAPGAEGQGELRGVNWRVRNGGLVLLTAGSRHRIAQVDGFVLVVGKT